ncbi:MAG: LD-carboxypeptidase [Gemmatimonadales bacterium]|nr:LD-carboxypeptidase [Gemmatimonadales bacterium]
MLTGPTPSAVPLLAPGARVALVAPAGPLLELDDVRRAEELVRALGWEPVTAANASNRWLWFAGTDDDRLNGLNAALRAATIDAIWCLRGGYGMTRILDRVDFAALRRRPRPVIGYSDITALLVACLRETSLMTFHAPMAASPLTPFSRFHLDQVLTRPVAAGRLGAIAPPADVLVPRAERVVTVLPGIAEGRLVGGNLTLLQCLVGTKWAPELDGAILFIEDVGEDLYRIDRMLHHLRGARLLERVAGVAVGRFTDMKREMGDGVASLDDVLRGVFEPLGIPVAHGFPIGHIESQWTVPLGARARLDATRGELELLEPAVRAR